MLSTACVSSIECTLWGTRGGLGQTGSDSTLPLPGTELRWSGSSAGTFTYWAVLPTFQFAFEIHPESVAVELEPFLP